MRVNKFKVGLALLILLLAAAVIHVLEYLGFLLAMAAGIIVGSFYLERSYD